MKTAIIDSHGQISYDNLQQAARQVASGLLEQLASSPLAGEQLVGGQPASEQLVSEQLASKQLASERLTKEDLDLKENRDLKEERIAFLTHSDRNYVKALWGIRQAGGVTVPLCPLHPDEELKYFIETVGCKALVADREHAERLQRFGLPLFLVDDLEKSNPQNLPVIDESRRANILFTSGTTNRPKGVVTTHANIHHQIETLLEAWHWSETDVAVNVLPLHHTHGLINVVSCALAAGATLYMHHKFDAAKIFDLICEEKVSVFMAVPTIYTKMIEHFESLPTHEQNNFSNKCRKLRLMISGSAALPVPVFERWLDISGHKLLERYGMTEIGMALSNPYEGERRPGSVGQPLPGVEISLLDEEGQATESGPGQILVRGPSVFKEYWNNPQATSQSFRNGAFLTGDIAEYTEGAYRILGRNNIDIIKSGGYKLSALEIESVLKAMPEIQEVAVVGHPDEKWGERVVAHIVAHEEITLEQLRSFCSDKLSTYKTPSRIQMEAALPKNAMGKVQKKQLEWLGKNA